LKSFIEKARKIHRNQRGFTLIELLVVMAILAILVGLVVPHLYRVPEQVDVMMIQGQRDQLRTAVFMYHSDTGVWPEEWSTGTAHRNQLWHHDVSGWDGPYIERPIRTANRWGGKWGVTNLNFIVANRSGNFTVLFHDGVPVEIRRALDRAMDDGIEGTGAVQVLAAGRLVIVIAYQGN